MDLLDRVIKETVTKHNTILDERALSHWVTPETAKDYELSCEKTLWWNIYKIEKNWKLISELKIDYVLSVEWNN